MNWIFAAIVSAILAQNPSRAAAPAVDYSLYRATLQCPGGEIPFRLELEENSNTPRAWIVNGSERILVPTVVRRPDIVVLDFEHYDSLVDAVWDGHDAAGHLRLRGTWRKRTGKNDWSKLPFEAVSDVEYRFPPEHGAATAAPIAGRWAVKFSKSDDAAIGVFKQLRDGSVEGTFLTPSGDYRYLAGDYAGGRLRLSCFDGSHAFLFDARMQPDGTLEGNFWSGGGWHEKWTARRDDRATLPDGFKATAGVSGVRLDKLKFPDLTGKERSLADPEFAGKARIIEVFGSWCPNCSDESAYLAELDRRYRSKGLRIVGLAFELTGDFQHDAKNVSKFAARHNAEYPILIAGIRDKEKASAALPMLDKLRAYPTTIFLDAKGNVRAVYTGFSGPATGDDYEAVKRQFEQTIDKLLAGR